MKVFKITPDYDEQKNIGLNPCTEKDIKAVLFWLEESEPGENILIEVKEMSEKEYNDLPEYMGP